MKSPFVSVIVVTYNSSKYIKSCLQALKECTYPKIETLVVDNGSTDTTLEIVKKTSPSSTIYINSANTGYAGGHTLGMSKAKGSYYFLINPDTIVSKNFLEPLIKVMLDQDDIAACQPLVYLENPRDQINLTGKIPHFLGFDWLRDYKEKSVRESGDVISVSGSGILLRKSAIKEVGGLDSTYFMYYEDSDLSLRLRMRGYRLWYCNKSIIYHDYKFVPDEKYQALSSKLFWAERNRLYTVFKNYSLKTLILLLPAMIFMEVGLLCYFALKGWLPIKLRSYASLFKARIELLSQRKVVQSQRTKSDQYVLKDSVATIEFSLFHHPVVTYIVNPILFLYWKLVYPLL